MNIKRLIVAMLLVSITVFGSASAYADGGAIRVHNNTSTTVTVNTESGYCCTADSGDTCSCVVTTGKHTLKAERHDTNKTRVESVVVPADGYDFNLSEGNP